MNSKPNVNSSMQRKFANRKLLAIGIIAVLMTSMVAIALQEIQPAFAVAKTPKHTKEDTKEANKDTKEDTKEAKQELALKKLRGSIFSLVGSGEANKKGKGEESIKTANAASPTSAKFKLSLFRATPHMVLLKVTNGTITIGGVKYTAEHGHAVVAMKAHKMILTTQVSNSDGKKMLRLFGNVNSTSSNTDIQAMNMHAIEMKGKLAQWSIEMKADLTKTG